jgi:hypothetical protein
MKTGRCGLQRASIQHHGASQLLSTNRRQSGKSKE